MTLERLVMVLCFFFEGWVEVLLWAKMTFVLAVRWMYLSMIVRALLKKIVFELGAFESLSLQTQELDI